MTQQTTNETTELLPCAHCAAHLEPFGPDQANHPRNDCWLSSVKVERAEFAAWNRRAALPPTSGEAVLHAANIPQQAPCRNKLINEGAQMWPKSCQRCGIAKCPDGLVPNYPASKPAPVAPVADTRAVLWLEADPSARGEDPHDVLGKYSMLYSIRMTTEKPTGSNPCWPLFFHPPTAPASPAPTADSAADAIPRGLVASVAKACMETGRFTLFMAQLDGAIDAMSTNTGEGK